jgi:hypothetical protein
VIVEVAEVRCVAGEIGAGRRDDAHEIRPLSSHECVTTRSTGR